MFRDLFFCGYPEGDYPFMNVGLLRGARRAFKLQIKLTTIYSLVIIGIDLIANMGYFVRASYGEIRNNTTFKVEKQPQYLWLLNILWRQVCCCLRETECLFLCVYWERLFM